MIIIPLLFIISCYFMVSLSISAEQFIIHYIISVLIYSSGSSLGLCIGSFVKDSRSVPNIIPLFM